MQIAKELLNVIRNRMGRRGLRHRDIDFFINAWQRMDRDGRELDWQKVTPLPENMVRKLPDSGPEAERLAAIGRANLGRCAIVKLNGGRSTTMGGLRPKCTVVAKDGKSFLDIILGQVIAANDRYGTEMPLVLMNSFFTDHVTDKMIGSTPLIILNFIQNEYPRIRKNDLMPLDTGTDDDWCPAGHGDFFASLKGTGMLDNLLTLGIRYLFISNIDNLSAEISPSILGAMIEGRHDFLMEVIRKEPADVKGGAPALIDGRPALVEVAQVPHEHLREFKNIQRFRHFNTNNLWLDLQAVEEKLANESLELPLIMNSKMVAGTEVIQIETAMGAALASFDRPGLVEVSRRRFAPVKKLADLFLLRSDIYTLDNSYRLSLNGERPPHLPPLPEVAFHSGFPQGDELENGFADPAAVSMLEAESLEVGGEVFFADKIAVRGCLRVVNEHAPRLLIDSDYLSQSEARADDMAMA